MKNVKILLLSTLFLLISFQAFSELIISNGSGNWDDTSLWIDIDGNALNRTPTDNDEILIDAGTEVTISTAVSLNDVTIAVRGILTFDRQWAPYDIGEFILNATSEIIVEDGATLKSDYWRSWTNVIEIGGEDQWNGFTDGEQTGPATIDTGGISSGTPPDYVPLPIELISFHADLSGEVVKISWATAAEINNDFFTLERSDNGVDWGIIGEEEGAGNSTLRLDYSFVDYSPIPGLSYYRLKQTDYDGQFEYFDPAVVMYEPDNLFKVFPNPTTDYIKISTSSDLSNASINIKNLNGQNEITENPSSAHQSTIDVSALPEGVYVLEIVFPESVLSRRIIKK